MKVRVKELNADIRLKNSGMELEIRKTDDSAQIGDCVVNNRGLTWCKGRTRRENGLVLKWEELELILASPEAKKAALKAAKSL